MRITALDRKARRQTLDLYIDDELAFKISRETCVTFGLREGKEISPNELGAVREAEAKKVAMKSALRLLSYRPRSEREVHDRLNKKGIDADVRDSTIRRLREVGFLDDTEFASSFADRRDRTSPRSRRLIASELRAKGVSAQQADEATSALDDTDAAYRAGLRKSRSMSKLPAKDFRRKLGNFLLQRGFNYGTSSQAVSRLWAEIHGDSPNGSSDPHDYG
jgi:regulatory protein